MPYNGGRIVSENEVKYFVRIANPGGVTPRQAE